MERGLIRLQGQLRQQDDPRVPFAIVIEQVSVAEEMVATVNVKTMIRPAESIR